MREQRKRRGRAVVVTGAVVGFLGLVVLNCSGLVFPLPGASGNLRRGLAKEFGVMLPASAVVEKGVYVAELDKSEFFMVQLVPGDVAGFEADLRRAATGRGYIVSNEAETRTFIGVGGPPWYTPEALPDGEALRVHIEKPRTGGTGYWFFFSPSTGKVFVYWYST